MKKDTITLKKSLLLKALFVSFLLLVLAFGVGLTIGKTDDSLQNLTSADEGETREQLSNCSFKRQEIIAKHLGLQMAAKKVGLIDENENVVNNLICTIRVPEKIVKENAEESLKKDIPDEKVLEKKNCSFSIQLFSAPNRTQALVAKKRYNLENTRLVEAQIKGRSWFRVRYGCYPSRAEAELDLPEIKDLIDAAIVVAD